MTFKPLLASPVDLDKLRFPVLVSPKLDGIRAIKKDGVLVSRKLLPIPNQFIQQCAKSIPEGLDGELMTYTNGKPDDFNTIQGNVMRQTGEPDFSFEVFDDCSEPDTPFQDRLISAGQKARICLWTTFLNHVEVNGLEELMEVEDIYLNAGFEGAMIRDPEGRYKFGRSTAREQILLKMKRFIDAEATVIGKVEKMTNANAPEKDALGHTKRSSAKAGKVPAGTLGALVCSFQGIEFEIGTGFDDAMRQQIWNEEVTGHKVTFKYQELTPAGVPRFPVFLGFRFDL